MDLFFGYIAGLLTLLNPCVLPVLPVILIAALNQHRLGPLALCAGLSVTFVVIGLLVASVGPALGVDDVVVSRVASVLMIVFGLILLVPALSSRFTMVASSASNSMAMSSADIDDTGLRGQFITGLLLGAVWSPCIGPTLGGAISLASQGNNVVWAGMIMISFAFGVSSIILLLATLSREALFKRRETMQKIAQYARPATGAILILLGLFLLFQFQHYVEAWAVQNLPYWLQDLSVRY